MVALAAIVAVLVAVLPAPPSQGGREPHGHTAGDHGPSVPSDAPLAPALRASVPASPPASGNAAAAPDAGPTATPSTVTITFGSRDRDIQLDRPGRRTRSGPPSDDPVLAWLPEIRAAAKATGVPPSLIAAVIRVESQGSPDAVSPDGARGLMQVMPFHLAAQGVPEPQWSDPAANIMAGTRLLGWYIEVHGTHWDGVAHYFGIGCDVFTCTDDYVWRVLDWDAHYAPRIEGVDGATDGATAGGT